MNTVTDKQERRAAIAKKGQRNPSAPLKKSGGAATSTHQKRERIASSARTYKRNSDAPSSRKRKAGESQSQKTKAAAQQSRKRNTTIRKSRKPIRRKAKGVTVGSSAAGAVILIILGLIFIPRLRRNANETGAAVPQGAFSYMLDISHHQKGIVWDSLFVMTDAQGKTVRNMRRAVRVKAPDYVVMKASEGENFRDNKFAEYWQEAEKRELKRGAYHFFLPNKNPEKQALNFIETVGGMSWRDLPPVLDVEIMPSSMDKAEFNSRVLSCLNALEKHYGVRPIVYAPDSFICNIFNDEIRSYTLWVAHYECEKPVTPHWNYWQFTDKAVVYGIEGKADLSIIR